MSANSYDFLAGLGIGQIGSLPVRALVNSPRVKFWDYEQGKNPATKLAASKTSKVIGKNNSSLYDSIKRLGVLEPVHISSDESGILTVLSGHHRIAAAHDIDPNMRIPFMKVPENFILPGHMNAQGNCPECYGSGISYHDDDKTGNNPITCPSCNGEGAVRV